MAQNEKVLWDILNHLTGKKVIMATTTIGQEPTESTVENAFSVGKLKGELVLKHRPEDIEDTIYFMKHREYLETHGYGLMAPEMIYSLTEKALEVAQSQELPEEEEKAFQESLWDINPKVYGMGLNWQEAWRRFKKRITKDGSQ